nr:hypothetical protein [Nocardioides albidus]
MTITPHAVGHQIVQLARDPGSLRRHGTRRLLQPVALGGLRALGHRGRLGGTMAHPAPESPDPEEDEPRRHDLVDGLARAQSGHVGQRGLGDHGGRADCCQRHRCVCPDRVQGEQRGEERLAQAAPELELEPGGGDDGDEDGRGVPATQQEGKGERHDEDGVHGAAALEVGSRKGGHLDQSGERERQHHDDVEELQQSGP